MTQAQISKEEILAVFPTVSATIANFEGLSNQDNFNVFGFRVNPPDTVGDVGPDLVEERPIVRGRRAARRLFAANFPVTLGQTLRHAASFLPVGGATIRIGYFAPGARRFLRATARDPHGLNP